MAQPAALTPELSARPTPLHALEDAWKKVVRDLRAGRTPRQLVNKGVRYARELATARWHLLGVDEVGPGVRTLAAPRIDNQGFMAIGAHTLLRSVNVPVELATAPGARLVIGPDCSLNYGVSIGCTGSITLGARCRLGPHVMIVDSLFHDLHDRSRRPPPEPVVLEDDVWVGAKASVLPGVRIGRGSVIGTGAVVTKDVAPFSVVVGVPGKVVKQLDPERFVPSRPAG